MKLQNEATHEVIEFPGECRAYEIGDIVGADILEEQNIEDEWTLICRQSDDCECAECQDLR